MTTEAESVSDKKCDVLWEGFYQLLLTRKMEKEHYIPMDVAFKSWNLLLQAQNTNSHIDKIKDIWIGKTCTRGCTHCSLLKTLFRYVDIISHTRF